MRTVVDVALATGSTRSLKPVHPQKRLNAAFSEGGQADAVKNSLENAFVHWITDDEDPSFNARLQLTLRFLSCLCIEHEALSAYEGVFTRRQDAGWVEAASVCRLGRDRYQQAFFEPPDRVAEYDEEVLPGWIRIGSTSNE